MQTKVGWEKEKEQVTLRNKVVDRGGGGSVENVVKHSHNNNKQIKTRVKTCKNKYVCDFFYTKIIIKFQLIGEYSFFFNSY